ncbi:MAG: PH domain-containing protein [Chloroflexota bacterium]|nr:PH domain-containing protein [Chloroflexota bacterium]
MIWKPPKALGLSVAFLTLAALLASAFLLARSLGGQQIGLGSFLRILGLIGDAALLAMGMRWALDLASLRYRLDRDALTIHCGTYERIVPMGDIERVVPASIFQGLGGFFGIRWPGYWRGHILIEGVGTVHVYATKPLRHQLIAVTGGGGYAISPHNAQEFLRDYAVRRGLGPLHPVTEHVEYGPIAQWPVWRDTFFWITCAAALLICVAISGILMGRYQELPQRLAFHLPYQGGVGRVASKRRLLAMPGLGAIMWAANTSLGILLHRRERVGAYLLILVALGLQVLFALALVSTL